MKRNRTFSGKKRGFTLLELIVVVVILGVLATVAMPRFLSVIESSRSAEALAILDQIRVAINRCGLWTGKVDACGTFNDLDIESPNSTPGAHFTYAIDSATTNGSDQNEITISATRTAVNGGNPGDKITLFEDGVNNIVTLSGTGAFKNLQ